MTAIHFARAASLGWISVPALSLALGAPVAFAQEVLPTIEVGRKTTAPPAAPASKPKPKPAAAIARTEPRPALVVAPLAQPKAPGEVASSLNVCTEKEVTERIYAQPQEALEMMSGLIVAQHSTPARPDNIFCADSRSIRAMTLA